MPQTSATATLAYSDDASRREFYASQWREQYPIVYENLNPIGRVETAEQASVTTIASRLASIVVEPTGLICSLVNSTPEAQAGLLLTLESLDPHWRVLLLAQSPHTILPTILSRVQAIMIEPWTHDELCAYAQQHDIDTALVAQAGGSQTRLRLLAQQAQYQQHGGLTDWLLLSQELTRNELIEVIIGSDISNKARIIESLQRGARADWTLATEWQS